MSGRGCEQIGGNGEIRPYLSWYQQPWLSCLNFWSCSGNLMQCSNRQGSVYVWAAYFMKYILGIHGLQSYSEQLRCILICDFVFFEKEDFREIIWLTCLRFSLMRGDQQHLSIVELSIVELQVCLVCLWCCLWSDVVARVAVNVDIKMLFGDGKALLNAMIRLTGTSSQASYESYFIPRFSSFQ